MLQDPAAKKPKEKKEEEEEDDSEDTLDWWSRYYETMKFIEAEVEDKRKKERKEKEKKDQEKEGKEDKKDKKDKKKEKTIQPDVSKTERKKSIPLIEVCFICVLRESLFKCSPKRVPQIDNTRPTLNKSFWLTVNS